MNDNNFIVTTWDQVLPDTSNQFIFHGTIEELKKYLPEMYEKFVEKNPAALELEKKPE